MTDYREQGIDTDRRRTHVFGAGCGRGIAFLSDGSMRWTNNVMGVPSAQQDILVWAANGSLSISGAPGLNVKALGGAIADGTTHPLSERYTTLTAAQLVYPFVTALTQEIDWAAITKTLNAVPSGAYASAQGRGGWIYLPGGAYYLGGDNVQVGISGTKMYGDGADTSVLLYSGTGTALANNGTTLRTRCVFKDFGIDISNGTSAKALDFTNFGNSFFGWLFLRCNGTNTTGIYGSGRSDGNGPFYNTFLQIDIQMNNATSADGSTGILLEQYSGGAGSTNLKGPNANTFYGGRISSGTTHIQVVDGNGNAFHDIHSESCRGDHYRVGKAAAWATGISVVSATRTSVTINSGPLVNALLSGGGAVHITSGTGAGQYMEIDSNNCTVITLLRPWVTAPDGTSVIEVWPKDATATVITGGHAEGSSSDGPDFLQLEPGAFRTTVYAPDVGSLGTGAKVRYIGPPRSTNRIQMIDDAETLTYQFTCGYTNATAASVKMAAGCGNVLTYSLPFDAHIVGIAVDLQDGTRSAGSLTVTPYVVAATTTTKQISTTLDATNLNCNHRYLGIYNNDCLGGVGTRLGCFLDTSSWTSTAADKQVTATVTLIRKS